jgi:hypothetical protein
LPNLPYKLYQFLLTTGRFLSALCFHTYIMACFPTVICSTHLMRMSWREPVIRHSTPEKLSWYYISSFICCCFLTRWPWPVEIYHMKADVIMKKTKLNCKTNEKRWSLVDCIVLCILLFVSLVYNYHLTNNYTKKTQKNMISELITYDRFLSRGH